MMSDIIAHICDHPERQACIILYIDIVKQTSKIFDIKSVFAKNLIKAIKKNKSLAHVEWSMNKVEKLLIFYFFVKIEMYN